MQKIRFILMAIMAATLVLNTGCKKPKAGAGAGGALDGAYTDGDGEGNYDIEGFGPIDGATSDDFNGGPMGARLGEENRITPPFDVQNVLFGYNSSTLDPSERPKVQIIADFLAEHPGVTVAVEGHCDERGSLDYNLALGERRALSVRDYFLQMGITGDRITTKTYGEEMPVSFEHSESAYRMNRRGEFKFYQQ